MKNREIATVFNNIADILEIRGENPFRIRAYRKAAQNVENLAEDIAVLAEKGELSKLPGIGKDLALKVREILDTGTLKFYEDLKQETPPELVTLLTIPGVGPRTAKMLFERFKTVTIDDLEKLAREHKLQGLPGIKAKIEENILKGIELVKKGKERVPLGAILPLANEIAEILKRESPTEKISVAGSVRRKRETIKDIDILITSSAPAKVIDAFTSLPQVHEVIAKGETKSSIRTKEGIAVDLRVVEPDSFGAALCYFTGSQAHNIRIRELAIRNGLKINEYGIFRGDKRIAGKEEKEIFKVLGLPYVPPEIREDRGEIEAALANRVPKLVEYQDMQGDIHVHSIYSDGKGTLQDIAHKAAQMGLRWVGVCDHSQSLKIAGGVSIGDLKRKIEEIRRYNEKAKNVKLLCGTEVDILSDGSLDYPDDVLKELDLVIAGIHTGFKQDEATLTRRIISAMRNPSVHVIAHPTGRLFGEREPYAINMEAVLKEAARTRTALEINAYPKRLDLNDIYSRAAKDKGILLAIGTDAHISDQMEYLHLGVSVARRGWLESSNLLNTLSYKELLKYLKNR
jgi:DNA polymerase (family 10)